MRTILYLLLVTFLSACTANDRRLEYALEFAGENRTELEKVLEHYKDEPEKLEAARFLIRNMPRWYSYEGCQLDSVKQLLYIDNIPPEEVRKWQQFSFYSLPKVYDAHIITAAYLIENIDLAFDVWKARTWNRTLGFDDFCEYILPYRVADEPLSSWRKLYHDYYAPIIDSTYQGSDVVEACRVVNAELARQGYRFNTSFNIPHQDAEYLFYRRVGYCREVCDFTLYAMRACGIPTATDFYVYSADYQHYHSWSVLRDTTGQFLQFNITDFEATREENKTDGRKKAKVYRECFGKQQEFIPGIASDDKVPNLFRNRYIKDVTPNYFGKNEVTVPLQRKKEKYIYLGVFSPGGWIPVDIALADGGQVTFRNLEPDVIYQPLYSDSWKLHPAGYPFVFAHGSAEVLKPDADYMEETVLKRKMPVRHRLKVYLYRGVIGSRLEAANAPSFINADLLYSFVDTFRTNYNKLTPLNTDKKYKYVRLFSPGVMELAELSLYQDSSCQKPISLHRVSGAEPAYDLDKITDGIIATYYQAWDSAACVTYRFDEPTAIGSIIFVPRNDDNDVWPGDTYELFYQDGVNGWKSLGLQTADGWELRYHAPQNALLWLRDRTKGREEQIFISRNGEQVFTSDL